MRNFIVFAMTAALLTIFNGCQKDEQVLIDEQPLEVVTPDVYVENDYLVFKSKEIFDSIRFEIEKYEIEKCIVWEQSLNFVSAKTERHFAEQELDKIDNQSGFQDFKKNYSNVINISFKIIL